MRATLLITTHENKLGALTELAEAVIVDTKLTDHGCLRHVIVVNVLLELVADLIRSALLSGLNL